MNGIFEVSMDSLPRENQMLEDTDPNKFIAKMGADRDPSPTAERSGPGPSAAPVRAGEMPPATWGQWVGAGSPAPP